MVSFLMVSIIITIATIGITSTTINDIVTLIMTMILAIYCYYHQQYCNDYDDHHYYIVIYYNLQLISAIMINAIYNCS